MTSILKDFPTEKDLKRLIMHTSDVVWQPNELTEKEINKWLDNFKGEAIGNIEEERILALWLLNHFVFYNEQEIRHLCKLVYKDFVHKQLISLPLKTNLTTAINTISSAFRFHYMGKPSESGSFILYYFRQENYLPMKYFLKFLDTEKDIEDNIIFIDDNTLTGERGSQAFIFFSSLLPKMKKRILLTFIATKKAIDSLKTINVEVISPIILDERDRCFNENSEIFIHHKSHLKTCEKMVSYYGNKIYPAKSLGFKNAQLMFGFFYNTPDNTIPIFWCENDGWYPIVKRYDKKHIYHFTEDERFV
jgi:hypothetical protein